MYRAFTFFLRDRAESIPAFELGFFDDEDAARKNALALLTERPRYTSVEVTDGHISFVVEPEWAKAANRSPVEDKPPTVRRVSSA